MKCDTTTMYASERPRTFFENEEYALADSLKFRIEGYQKGYQGSVSDKAAALYFITQNPQFTHDVLSEYLVAINELKLKNSNGALAS